MAASPVEAPQPGNDRSVLFVGSNTAPNVLGLKWFLEKVWPDVRSALPDCKLQVAGPVRDALAAPPDGVAFLGLVPDLDPLYRAAGVVISPLPVGSGLKVKLIEAMSRGKATVATSATLEGIETLAGAGVTVADAAGDFASAIVQLLGDPGLRERKGAEALDAVRRRFSPEACYAELMRYVEQPLKDVASAVPSQAS
jgi:succinoglycan biosynthesis protein ExoO